jgi:acetyltransferase
MTAYPAHLARERRLRDGRNVVIRPIRPSDEAHEKQFFASLSGDTKAMRFQRWVNSLTDQLVHFFANVDYSRHMAFVCAFRDGDAEQLVGEARYLANPDERSCEFGVVIADDWHKSGIAGLLMEALVRCARANGLETMEGIVLARNEAMLRFVDGLGFECFPSAEDPSLVRIIKKL